MEKQERVMMIKAGRFLVVYFFMFTCLVPLTAFAGLKVSTVASDNNLEVGDQVTLTVDITSDQKITRPGPKFQPPVVKGLDYMGVQESSSTSISFNGMSRSSNYKITQIITYACMKEGSFVIPSVSLDLPGGLKTKEIRLKVYKELPKNLKKKRSSVASRGRNKRRSLLDQFMGFGSKAMSGVTAEFNPDFFAEVEVDKTTIFEGEQLIATWYVYISEKTTMQNFDTLEFPTLRGFWKEDINFATRFYWKPVVRDGKKYLRSMLNSYALTPYNAGTFDVDSFKLRVVVSPQSFFSQNRKVLLAESKKTPITVKPLPQPVPETFLGGVGRFKVDSGNADQKKQVLYAEPFRHKIRIIGDRANAKFIKAPKIELGEEFGVYNVKESYEFVKAKVSSYKDFTHTLIPKKEGVYTLPDTKVTFLDPQTEEYYDLYLKFPTFKVLPNKNAGKIRDEDFNDLFEDAELEDAAFKVEDKSFSWDFLFFNFSWKVQFLLFLMFLSFAFWYYKKFSLFKETQTQLIEKLEKRTAKAAKMFQEGHRKASLDELINIYSLLIGGVLGKRFGVEETFSKATEHLPPSLKSQASELELLNENLQSLRFGSTLESRENQDKLEKCLNQFKTLFTKIRVYLR